MNGDKNCRDLDILTSSMLTKPLCISSCSHSQSWPLTGRFHWWWGNSKSAPPPWMIISITKISVDMTGALDVPAWACSPRTVPRNLTWLSCLPEQSPQDFSLTSGLLILSTETQLKSAKVYWLIWHNCETFRSRVDIAL